MSGDRLAAWTARLCDDLGLPADAVDRDLVLDLARDAAHGVARPAAPLTTFVAGLAAGRRGGTAADVDAVTAAIRSALAQFDDDAG